MGFGVWGLGFGVWGLGFRGSSTYRGSGDLVDDYSSMLTLRPPGRNPTDPKDPKDPKGPKDPKDPKDPKGPKDPKNPIKTLKTLKALNTLNRQVLRIPEMQPSWPRQISTPLS